MLFDTHSHYCDSKFKDNLPQVLEEVFNSGVGRLVTCASNIKDSLISKYLAEKYPEIYFSAGVHPHDSERADPSDLDKIEELAHHPKCVAIGECGLDYHYDFSPRDIQKQWFEWQCELENKLNMPIIVHDREAHADTFEILKKHKPKMVLHCYSGSLEMAKEYIKLGAYISFSGTVTFKNARGILDVVRYMPSDRILIETDCPYLAPEPMRGKINTSAYLKYTAQVVANLRGISFESLAKITTDNANKFFGLE